MSLAGPVAAISCSAVSAISAGLPLAAGREGPGGREHLVAGQGALTGQQSEIGSGRLRPAQGRKARMAAAVAASAG